MTSIAGVNFHDPDTDLPWDVSGSEIEEYVERGAVALFMQ